MTAVTVHASGDYLVTASLDRTWAFYDLAAQLCLAQARPSARAAAADQRVLCFHVQWTVPLHR